MATISNICFWFLLPRLLFLRLRRIHLLPPSVSSRSLAGKVYDTLFSHKYSYASCSYVYHRPGKSLTLENLDNYRNSKLTNLCLLIRKIESCYRFSYCTWYIWHIYQHSFQIEMQPGNETFNSVAKAWKTWIISVWNVIKWCIWKRKIERTREKKIGFCCSSSGVMLLN